MTDTPDAFFTAFDGPRRIASGPLHAVALVVKHAIENRAAGPVLMFDDTTGRSVDIDTRGSDEEVVARLSERNPGKEHAAAEREFPPSGPRGRGRPKLGVVPREVTLLPRHWEWLAAQPGGASVALRKLVEEARRTHVQIDRRRQAQECAYQFMAAMAGDLPGFEQAARALFANDQQRLRELAAPWPADVREHALTLACRE